MLILHIVAFMPLEIATLTLTPKMELLIKKRVAFSTQNLRNLKNAFKLLSQTHKYEKI